MSLTPRFSAGFEAAGVHMTRSRLHDQFVRVFSFGVCFSFVFRLVSVFWLLVVVFVVCLFV